MKILFANLPIAVGPDFGGFDAVTGFKPEGKTTLQRAGWLRAPYETFFTRGNRVITLTGTIEPAPKANAQAALLALAALYPSLPDQGDLVFMLGADAVTYPGATLESFKPVKNVNGVSYAFELTFSAGRPGTVDATSDAPVTDPGGAVETDPSGVAVTDP